MNKVVGRNVSVILGGYILLALVANYGSGVVIEHMPSVLLFGALATVVMMGYLCSTQNKKWLDGIVIALPYVMGMMIYGIARVFSQSDLIKMYRMIVPYSYTQVDLVGKMTFGIFSRDIVTVLTLVLSGFLSYGALRLGMKLRQSEKIFSKIIYNNILIWGIHFYVVTLLGQIVLDNPTLLTNDKMRMISGAVVTVIIFVIYFGIGKLSKSLNNAGLQIVSSCSVSLTALGMYIASLLLLYPSGRYEIFILPIAQSFFGVIGKAAALQLGAEATYISQYGIIVSIVLMLMPIVLVYVGHSASRQVVDLKGAAEGENNGEVLSN